MEWYHEECRDENRVSERRRYYCWDSHQDWCGCGTEAAWWAEQEELAAKELAAEQLGGGSGKP